MKTVTHKGKVYQIGAVYEFLMGCEWRVDVLSGFINDEPSTEFEIYEQIRLCAAPHGTIEDAPIELESGHCYYCEINQNTEKPEYATMFFLGGEWYWDSELSDVCKDFAPRYIKPLYKMVRVS